MKGSRVETTKRRYCSMTFLFAHFQRNGYDNDAHARLSDGVDAVLAFVWTEHLKTRCRDVSCAVSHYLQLYESTNGICTDIRLYSYLQPLPDWIENALFMHNEFST